MEQLSALSSLYAGDLHPDVTDSIIFELFRPFGSLHSVRVCRDVASGRSLRYAYVNFLQRADAERALDTMMFAVVMGQPMRIMWAQRNASLRKSGVGNIIIKNLDRSIDSMALYDTFSHFGTILSCKVMCDENGSKGYGFVHFENLEAADRAIRKLNGMLLNDRKVSMEHYKTFKAREAEKAVRANGFTNISIKNIGMDRAQTGLKQKFDQTNEKLMAKCQDDGMVETEAHPINKDVLSSAEPSSCQTLQSSKEQQVQPSDKSVQTLMTVQATPKPEVNPSQAAGQVQAQEALTASVLAAVPPQEQKQMLGERLLPLIRTIQPTQAVKITDLLLQLNTSKLLHILNCPQSLSSMVDDAVAVLQFIEMNKASQKSGSSADVKGFIKGQAQEALTASVLADIPPQEQKKRLGELLFPLIKTIQPTQARKITDLLLQLNTPKLLDILDCPQSLCSMVGDAVDVLQFTEMNETSQKSQSSTAVKETSARRKRTRRKHKKRKN